MKRINHSIQELPSCLIKTRTIFTALLLSFLLSVQAGSELPSYNLELQIVHGMTGEPVADATVTFWSKDKTQPLEAVTDENGRLSQELTAGKWVMETMPRGFSFTRRNLVLNSQPDPILIEVSRAVVVDLHITNREGEFVDKAWVELQRRNSDPIIGGFWKEETYRFFNIAPGATYTLSVRLAGYQTLNCQIQIPDDATHETLSVVLEKSDHAQSSKPTSSSTPQNEPRRVRKEYSIHVTNQAGEPITRFSTAVIHDGVGHSPNRDQVFDDQGNTRISYFETSWPGREAPAPRTLSICAPGFTCREVSLATTTESTIDIVLEPSKTITIAGTLLDENGDKLPGITIMATDSNFSAYNGRYDRRDNDSNQENSRQFSTITDANGNFRFQDIALEGMGFHLWLPKKSGYTGELNFAEQLPRPLTFNAEKTASLTIQVDSEHHPNLNEFSLSNQLEPYQRFKTGTLKDGVCRYDYLEPGIYRLVGISEPPSRARVSYVYLRPGQKEAIEWQGDRDIYGVTVALPFMEEPDAPRVATVLLIFPSGNETYLLHTKEPLVHLMKAEPQDVLVRVYPGFLRRDQLPDSPEEPWVRLHLSETIEGITIDPVLTD